MCKAKYIFYRVVTMVIMGMGSGDWGETQAYYSLVGDRPHQYGRVLYTLRRHQRHSLYPGFGSRSRRLYSCDDAGEEQWRDATVKLQGADLENLGYGDGLESHKESENFIRKICVEAIWKKDRCSVKRKGADNIL
ncbi:hypothetical protein NPIL_555601 [Nephila pilipes]|uniref:Uncharacterized protein n=1 Tax=Nephila pilipes TaxID=299642 RepID=A0A8X6P8C2_NEPPI|nr:hypothetical protein NPIL_530971 [Nephila pilipes]GFT51465.1 hypothetical protein NPIL_484241 [Nephila pilipes]GFT92319.1 hypothetical protein NPIL_473741 [Nephila pilipes]GFU60927.1 hypothetical protein NPIL_555601 [Nephila pilipes]